jgi:undecaprenyl-diphosphatase
MATLAGVAAVTLALTVAAAGPGLLPGDVMVARWLQALPHPTGPGLAWFAFWAGSAHVVLAVGAVLLVIFWQRGERRLAAIVAGILLLRVANPLLKELVASPRPGSDEVTVTELASHFGFPSGHVMGATLLYGGVIWLAEETVPDVKRRRAVQAAAALVIAITCFGRVYTGAHWPSDVLGGLLWGVTGLVVLGILAKRVESRKSKVESQSSIVGRTAGDSTFDSAVSNRTQPGVKRTRSEPSSSETKRTGSRSSGA